MTPSPPSPPSRPAAPPLWVWTPAARGVLIAGLGLGLIGGWVGWWQNQRGETLGPTLPPLVLDLNSAPLGAIGALPGIGPARAQAIVAHRAQRPFDSLDDLDRRVPGIGPATVRALAPFVQFSPAAPPAP